MVTSSFPNEQDTKEITDVLKRFDGNYDTSIRNKAGLKKMKMIEGLLQSEDHCRITDFTFEL